MDIRHDARHRHAAQLLERFEPRLQDLLISTEFVDDGAADARSLVRLEQRHGAVELREHAAAVNVADEEHRRVHELREAHVHDVLLLEISAGLPAPSMTRISFSAASELYASITAGIYSRLRR